MLGSAALLLYWVGVWLLFNAFVLLYEEPALARRHGAAYDAYRTSVRRWWPRTTRWPG